MSVRTLSNIAGHLDVNDCAISGDSRAIRTFDGWLISREKGHTDGGKSAVLVVQQTL